MANPSIPTTWRPWPLRWPFLLVFIILSVLLCVAIELIIHACSETGCPIYGRQLATALSSETYIIYNLLPTVVSLCLGLLWAVPHHDVIRLEPYFQMSADGGATAADSILLDYLYAIPPFLPFVAGKRK